MTVVAEPVAAQPQASPPGSRARRPEIEGLRALAVALVVVYHVFSGRVSGGVDVFLTLTGFFLVVTLGERFARTDGFNPVRPIARSLSRLAPAAFVVLAATVLAAMWVAPRTRWREVVDHLVSSVTFTENLRLVDESVSYAALNAATSPMQQFWSLSIQVQVLLAAPFVVAAVGLLLRATGRLRHGRRVAIALVAAGTAASFVWALVAVRADQQAAYFASLPRLWELGAGALAGLLLVDRRPGRTLAAVLGWVGVVGLVVCGAVLDGARTFPGWQAAWPVLCALLILFAADAGGRNGAHRLLSLRPLQWVGRRSYGIYLWHWPILVLYLVRTGGGRPSLVDGTAVIAAAVVLAAVTYRLAERPALDLLRSRRPAWAVALVIACAAPLVVAGATTTAQLDRELAGFVPAADDPDYPGARALLRPALMAEAGDVEAIPPLSVIRDDWARLSDSRCVLEGDEDGGTPLEPFSCVRGPADAERRIVLVGDSHVAHWLHPVAQLVDSRGWQLVALINPGCNLSTESEFRADRSLLEQCEQWRSRIVERIASVNPGVVLALGTRIAEGEREVLPKGFVEAWQQLSDLDIPVIGLRDNPRHERDVPDCMAELGDLAPECTVSPADIYDDALLEADLPAGVQLLDTRPYFCTSTECPSVVGNVRVYRDDSHVTNMYMRTVGPVLEPDLLALTGW
ncbi:acyltransferase family protein [Blastococcus haudaquaticus]|uniref:Peptidoglycan/LPS O-acetylase OafA/YrhL, contains acyltransferase and SGNH-hydrolase domains n=1 Tax=Blastococcus haudaquaticus TaxID=1938745 RepID=A0A286H541_9ACTN|nr:acyltransferase family protein [Blastococcus haudaquaticus]SOE02915.1 Peptidoglycan/LPS O-acetylase OafA/YrhL, contains acyltransferase and SGNH-hydrolase domains [Blastococcus haudaquaticus]